MKRVRLKLYSYHTFLVVPFIVLFLFGHNIRQASLDMLWRSLILGLGLSALLFGIFYLLFKNRLKTGVFVTILLFGMLQYGTWYEFFERLYYNGNWPFSNIHRYLLGLYVVILTTAFLVIRFSKHDFIRINYFLNVLLLLLVVFNLFQISSRGSATLTEKTAVWEKTESIPFAEGSNKPDIYFILLDGYASENVLRKYYGFDNSGFTGNLRGLGFSICDSARANHYYTSRSLCATLNMDLNIPATEVQDKLTDNRVMRLLSQNGYKVYYLNSGYAVTEHFTKADSCIRIDGPNEFEKGLMRHTIFRLDDLVGFFARQRLISQFSKMTAIPDIAAHPKFCFIHIVAPHPPYVFDRNGNLRTRHRFAEHSWEPRGDYVEQLEFVNKQAEILISSIRKKQPGAVIILQSDHGPWITADTREETFEARSEILYALYSSPRISIPRKTTPVNTFRYVFNDLFGTGLSLLPDSLAGKEGLMKDPILLKKLKTSS